MNNQEINGLASLGRGEDNYLAHVAKGEMIVPPLGISEETRNRLNAEMQAIGLNPKEYTVGSGMSVNPITGIPEFGFFKKIGKVITKINDKTSKIAQHIPGPHQPYARMYAQADQALEQKKLAKRAEDARNSAQAGSSPVFNPQASGLSGLFGGLGGSTSFLPQYNTSNQNLTGTISNLYDMFFKQDESNPNQKEGILEKIFGLGAPLMGVNPVTGGIAGLYGLATKKAAEKEQYGIKDIRDSIRPDLGNMSMAPPMGFNVGYNNLSGVTPFNSTLTESNTPVRVGGPVDSNYDEVPPNLIDTPAIPPPEELNLNFTDPNAPNYIPLMIPDIGGTAGYRTFQKGGIAESIVSPRPLGYAKGGEVLDMRNGGESIGPGTGVSDDIPAMLSDGEFVMTAAANKGIGGFKLTKSKDSIELIPNSKPNRETGASNMMDLMKTFEQYNKEYSV